MEHEASAVGTVDGMAQQHPDGDISEVIARSAEVVSGVSAILVDMSEYPEGITPSKLYALSSALDDAASMLDGIW